MKPMRIGICVLLLVGFAFAQDEPAPAAPAPAGGPDLVREIWFMDDANPVDTGVVDLRLVFRWVTASAPANLGDSDDDFIFTPALTWGPCSNVEVFADVPIWLGDSGDRGALDWGNFDANVGFTWRISEPVDMWPAAALRTTVRLPTGDDSHGVDAELRLLLTNEYESGIRSHLNMFAATDNSDPGAGAEFGALPEFFGFGDGFATDPRHFQWGFVAGLDGPLCGDGAVRWVADYLHRSSYHYGAANINMLELGWQWAMADTQRLGMSLQIGLDDEADTPNFGAVLGYTCALTQ